MILDLLFLAVGINLVGFLIAYIFKSDRLTDFSYGLTFLVLVWSSFFSNKITSSSLLGLVLISLWAARLAGFLLMRIMILKKDKRFDGVRENFIKFGQFWIGQGITAWMLLLPYFYVSSNQYVDFKEHSMIGVVILLGGLIIETFADKQKFSFTQNPKNKDRFINVGLWKYSRHPNYFGEILVWLGLYLFAFPYLTTSQRFIATISPLFISFLLIFVTGLPKLEKYADEKWGEDEAYQSYKKRTSILILLPNKK